MDTGTNTDTQSSYESLLFSRDENHKSPESSDCEGYATPLASSLPDISGVTINLPDDKTEERRMSSGELTPKIRASSPPVVKQVMFLQKPDILVMTQRELTDEEYNVQKDEASSEEEFYDVADVHIRDVALQLLSAVSEPESEKKGEEERVATPIVAEEIERSDVADYASNEESGSATPVFQEDVINIPSSVESKSLEDVEEAVAQVTEAMLLKLADDVIDGTEEEELSDEYVGDDDENESEEDIKVEIEVQEEQNEEVECTDDEEVPPMSSNTTQEPVLEVELEEAEIAISPEESPASISQEVVLLMNPETETETETETMEETPPVLVISDEVKTSQTTSADEDSIHQVKVDFDGYSSGREESLSSSTSSESFEFTETVPHLNSDEKTQAIRDSINERYPTNGSDDDDDDEQDGEDYDEDLLAVKQISAEVEQLVAAINAFGRDEEQQMSAYLVEKNMAAEKKRKSAMDVVSTSPNQLVQTDNESFIFVDRHLPDAMENLQVEIDRLKVDLERSKSGEKELLSVNAKLQNELEESQQTIDGIEIEAEQQYTELTSEIDELCDIVLKKDQELAVLKEKVANLTVNEINLKDDVDAQRVISQRQKEIIEGLREELDAISKKLIDVTKSRDKAIEEATIYKMKNMERERFLSREAQMSMEIEDLQRELNKQRLILNGTSMAKLADTFDRKVLQLENELRERDMLICKQNQIINSHRKSPTGSIITTRKMQPRASVLAAAGNLPSAGSSSESFQNGLDLEAKEALLSFILSDRHNQLANIYNIGRILDLTPHEERAVERHLTKDRFT